jgi:MerR family Zn(II)-responsive transcriptional regulator of zntA
VGGQYTMMEIGQLAEAAGVTRRTIRYYVSLGLLPPGEEDGTRRLYDERHLRRLAVIRRMKDAFLPLEEIRRRLEAGDEMESPAPSVPLSGITLRVREMATPLATLASAEACPSEQAEGDVVMTYSKEPGAPHRMREEAPRAFRTNEPIWCRKSLRPWLEMHVRDDAPAWVQDVVERVRRMLDER